MAQIVFSGGDLEPPTAILWVYHFLAQHFDYLRDSKKAMEYIDKALEHTPTLIEAYMVKARIYKVMEIKLRNYSYVDIRVIVDSLVGNRLTSMRCTYLYTIFIWVLSNFLENYFLTGIKCYYQGF